MYVPKQRFADATKELASSLNGKQRDFVERVRRLFVEKPNKFMTLVVYPVPASGTDEAKSPALEVTELMQRLMAATREGDFDQLAIIEHEANS